MPSPFVGMDPFLEDERLWPWFQHLLGITLERTVSVELGDRYSVHRSNRLFRSESQDHCEEYIGIHAKADGRLVTLLEIASPADKLTEAGRAACRDSRRTTRETGASVEEIDLVLRGQPLLEYSREGLPQWDYSVTVERGTSPERYEIYTATIEKRLPRFRVPMASGDRDIVVDLQESFNQAYEDGGFGDQIDYGNDLPVTLGPEVFGRVAAVLRERRR